MISNLPVQIMQACGGGSRVSVLHADPGGDCCRMRSKGATSFGRAQTGTGKTAAFLIAMFTRLLRDGAWKPAQTGLAPGAGPGADPGAGACRSQKDAEGLGQVRRFARWPCSAEWTLCGRSDNCRRIGWI